MTEKVTTAPRWAVTRNSFYWAGADDWAPDSAGADVYPSKQAAKDAYRDAHGKFPRTLDAVELGQSVPEVPEVAPGGVTDETPGQTARVAAAIAKAEAAAAEAEECPCDMYDSTGDEPYPLPAEKTPAEEFDEEIQLAAESAAALVGYAHDRLETIAKKVNAAREAGNDYFAELGFPSWPAYLADRLAPVAEASKSIEQRQAVVAMLTDAGMSTRAIAPIVGVSNKTVSFDQKAIADNAETGVTSGNTSESGEEYVEVVAEVIPMPAKVTGLDGKTYTRPAPAPKPPPLSDYTVPGRPWITAPKPAKVDKLTDAVDAVIAEIEALAAKIQVIADAVEDRKLKVADGTYYGIDQRLTAISTVVGESVDSLLAAVQDA